MTIAVATSTSTKQTVPHAVPIVILGTDAVLAAQPATAVQLAHACIEAGFVNVIPASWGDELIATGTLRRLPEFGDGPVIQCSCPIVAHRLLSVSSDLRPVMLPLVPPPVALARYVRVLSKPNRVRVTYVGGCPGAIDESIDIRMTPDALLSLLAERGIALDEQPLVFESFVPADRRRYRSLPGGLPTPDALWSDYGSRSLVEIEGDDFAAEIAQHVLGGRSVLIDAAVKMGCACSGAIASNAARDARAFVASLEPPRAAAPVINENAPVDLDLPIPVASRTPADVMAIPPIAPTTYSTPTRGVDASNGSRLSPPRGIATVADTRQPARNYPPTSRPVGGSSPVVRTADGREGKPLPRAYVARRRLSPPKSSPVVPPEPLSEQTFRARQEIEPDESLERVYSVELIELESPDPAPEGIAALGIAALGIAAPAADLEKSIEIADERDESGAPEPDVDVRVERAVETVEPIALAFAEPVLIDTVAPRFPIVDEEHPVAMADTPLTHNDPVVEAKPTEPVVEATPTIVPEPVVAPLEDSKPAAASEPTVLETFARPDQPPQAPYVPPAAPQQPPFNARHVVLILLAVVVVAVAVSATVAILFERRFFPRVTTATSTDHP